MTSVIAWPHEGILPIELWDVLVGDDTLFALRDDARFYPSLVTAVLALRAGRAVRADGARLAPCPWEAVALVGGALDESRARDAFDAAGVALDVVAADPFFASAHAREALAAEDPRHATAVVIDVGQTAIKVTSASARLHRARDTGAVVDPRGELVGQIASALEGLEPSFVLLALPCEIDTTSGAIVLGASTYPTKGEGAGFIREILARAGYAGVPAAVVNDAILAAWALARRAPSYSRARLVLTVGLGVGAALVDRAARL